MMSDVPATSSTAPTSCFSLFSSTTLTPLRTISTASYLLTLMKLGKAANRPSAERMSASSSEVEEEDWGVTAWNRTADGWGEDVVGSDEGEEASL